MKFILVGVISMLLTSLIFYNLLMPKIIFNRAERLNFTQYNAKIDKKIYKDSMIIDEWDLYYLTNGTMNKND